MAVARLKEMQVPYKLAGGGGTILVPEPRLAEVRLQLATDGLPQSGRLGFELFDGSNFGATEFAEHVNFRRALEGELERSVLSLSEVERARVHISLPKKSVFLDRQQPSKASVVLQLRPGKSLSKEQIDAISFLVASAVEGLEAGKVVVVDTGGRVLARPRPDSGGFSGAQLEYQRELEQAINGRILETLEPYIGFDRVRSSVVVECDWNTGEQTEEILDPETVVMTSQRSQEGAQPLKKGGIPGTASNLPRQPEPAVTEETGVTRILETTNYQTSRTVTRMNLARGEVKRLSVAVLVDHRIELDEEARKLIRVTRTAEEMRKFRQLVIAAAGIIEERGDVLTIETLPFTIFGEPLEPPPPPLNPEDNIFSLEWLNKYRYNVIAVCPCSGSRALYRLVRATHQTASLADEGGSGQETKRGRGTQGNRGGGGPGARAPSGRSQDAEGSAAGDYAEFQGTGPEEASRRDGHQGTGVIRPTIAVMDPRG